MFFHPGRSGLTAGCFVLPRLNQLERGRVACAIVVLVVALGAAGTTNAVDSVAPAPAEQFRISRKDAVAAAVAGNPAIAAAREQVEQARARVAEATALPDPAFVTTLEEETGFLSPRTATTKDFGLDFAIPFPSKLHLSGNVARSELKSAEFALTQLHQQIAVQTEQAYDALLVALLHDENLKEAKKLADDFLSKTQSRFEAGTVPKLDVIKAKVDVAQAENDLIAEERTISTARANLNRLLVRPLGSSIEATDPLEVPTSYPDVETLEKIALASRPEILGNMSDREGARQATTLAARYWLPDFDLTLSRNYTTGDPPAYSMGLSVSLPLFFWQHNKGFIAEATHREAELAATANDLSAQIGLDVRTSWATATTALKQAIYIRDELLPEARDAFRIASTAYGLGGASALELLDAKRTMLDAETQYADALGAANDARADLERAVGAPLPSPSGEANEK